MWLKRRINLPTTPEGFEALIKILVRKYKLPDRDHASAIVSNAIRHLPNDQDWTTYDYLARCVLKNLANYAASHVSEKLKHEAGVRQLADMLRADPFDMQARDQLQKAADQGSPTAKTALEKLDGKAAEPAISQVASCLSIPEISKNSNNAGMTSSETPDSTTSKTQDDLNDPSSAGTASSLKKNHLLN